MRISTKTNKSGFIITFIIPAPQCTLTNSSKKEAPQPFGVLHTRLNANQLGDSPFQGACRTKVRSIGTAHTQRYRDSKAPLRETGESRHEGPAGVTPPGRLGRTRHFLPSGRSRYNSQALQRDRDTQAAGREGSGAHL